MFTLTAQTKIHSDLDSRPVERAIRRFYRDLGMTMAGETEPGSSDSIRISRDDSLNEEAYIIEVKDRRMDIRVADELGCIYALNYISREYLGIQPLWFWNDQMFEKREARSIDETTICSSAAAYRFRGWFVNDEVLLHAWTLEGSKEKPWEMVMETLLRLGGNLVIPGTDHNAKIYSDLAADMGLWITHHHAEPLGAEMFLRAYPDLNPSFAEHPDLFRQLWEEGVLRQRNKKVVWNIGFRGQGDRPFWLDDERYATDRSRGELIGSIMEEQRLIVQKHVDHPVFCTNLYGEMVELYQQGHLRIADDTIKIWGDNGYGKMVARRQHGVNARPVALPAEDRQGEAHGVYYHASFYDLQAASHMTLLPNSLAMVRDELVSARQRGVREFIIVNCSNVKPHVYTLQAIAELWSQGDVDTASYPERYVNDYFAGENGGIAELFDAYASCAPRYGDHPDEGCGDQFYNYTTRQLLSQWLRSDTQSAVEGMRWACPEQGFAEQVSWYARICAQALEQYGEALSRTHQVRQEVSNQRLLDDSIGLQYRMYYEFAQGGSAFCRAFERYCENNYMAAFYELGKSKEAYEAADQAMRDREHGHWQGFYYNDCLTDVKQTAYWLGILMGVVRNMGEGPHFFRWQREVLYAPEDRNVILITNFENHLTNEELYEAMKAKGEG